MLKINCPEADRASWILETAQNWFLNQTSSDIIVTCVDDDQMLTNYQCHKLILSALLDKKLPISLLHETDNIILTNVSSTQFEKYLNSAFEFISKEEPQVKRENGMDIEEANNEVLNSKWNLNEHELEVENLDIADDILDIGLTIKEEFVSGDEKDPIEEKKIKTEIKKRKSIKKNKSNKSKKLKGDKENGFHCEKKGCEQRIFTHKWRLNHHNKIKHSALKEEKRIHSLENPEPKKTQCSYCDYKTVISFQLREHERTHTGEKPEICNFCQKGFSQRKTLETHKRTHTGEKPYKCKFCDLCFAQRTSVNYHIKANHKELIGEGKEKLFILNKKLIDTKETAK